MKHRVIRHAVPLVLLGLSLLATAQEQEKVELGRIRYDCQVNTIHNLQGWVGVRADSLQEAVAIASRSQGATTRLETHEPVKEVVQCVQWPNGRFTDAGFQVWFAEVLPK